MGGFFGVASKADCVADLFYGTDYHAHLGTSRGGMAKQLKTVRSCTVAVLKQQMLQNCLASRISMAVW